MGVTYFYFRASNVELALELMRKENWFANSDGEKNKHKVVPLKGIDHCVMLGRLIAIIRSKPFCNEIVKSKTIWPPLETKPKTPEDYANLSPDSPWLHGPYLERLDMEIRDDLQSVDLNMIEGLAEQWAEIEEWDESEKVTVSQLGTIITDLVILARNAYEKNEMMFVLSIL